MLLLVGAIVFCFCLDAKATKNQDLDIFLFFGLNQRTKVQDLDPFAKKVFIPLKDLKLTPLHGAQTLNLF